jgi:hypothetical protein
MNGLETVLMGMLRSKRFDAVNNVTESAGGGRCSALRTGVIAIKYAAVM